LLLFSFILLSLSLRAVSTFLFLPLRLTPRIADIASASPLAVLGIMATDASSSTDLEKQQSLPQPVGDDEPAGNQSHDGMDARVSPLSIPPTPIY